MDSRPTTQDFEVRRVLVTGAAGFIGSNLVEALLERGTRVVGVDNFLAGRRENVNPFLDRITFIEGDLQDIVLCHRCCADVDVVLHQAALGSVPRSVADPLTTNRNNIDVTLNMLIAARDAGVKKFVYAASSSAYGEAVAGAKVEEQRPAPISPYAVTKLAGELYAGAFARTYGLKTIALRYFNVFGPRQDPNGPYAAVIPRFIQALLRGERPEIYGDGEQTRDFTYVANVVKANLLAVNAPDEATGQMFNIGAGSRTTVNELFKMIAGALGSDIAPIYRPPRKGDIRDSQASIDNAGKVLGYHPEISVEEGIQGTVAWFKDHLGNNH